MNKKVLISIIIAIIAITVVGIVYFNTDEQSKRNEPQLSEANNQERGKKVERIDLKKCLNMDTSSSKVEQFDSNCEGELEFSYKISDEKTKVNISFSYETINTIYGLSNNNTGKANYVIDNFKGKVVDVYLLECGQDYGNETVYFLMEDGTVEYMPFTDICKNKDFDFKSYGNISNVGDVLYITGVGMSEIDGGGFVTAIGVKENGDFYELPSMIEDMNNI